MSTMFVSYAAADERLWKQIETQLKPYSGGSAGQIELWSPHDIIAGQVRKREIEEHLKTARTILLLLSPDYFFDAECEQQMRAALARRQEGGDQVDVVPILLRPCLWQRDGLEDLQILPHNKVPVTKWSDRDEVLLNITIEIRLIIGHVDKSGPVTVPPLSPPKEEVDVGIIIALKEEFSVLFADIGAGSRAVHDTQTNEIYYRFERNSSVTGRPYRCITTFIGGMGPTQAALQAERMITRWNPSTLVLPGIAASLSSSARLGDIVVADQVDGYMENAKANPVAGNQGYDLAFSGEAYRTSSTLLKEVQNFEFTTPAMFHAWQKGTEATLQQLVGTASADLISKKMLREQAEIINGHIASGPVVGAAQAFTDWLKGHDRKYLALEMEAAGLMTAVYNQASTKNTNTLILRAISDYGTKEKGDLDNIGEGALRRYAMHNAIQLLWSFLDAGLLLQRS